MSALILTIFYFFNIALIIWYFTCTKHKEVPLILVLLDFILSMIPGFNIITFFINLLVIYGFADRGFIELKDNWFNRVFLAHEQ